MKILAISASQHLLIGAFRIINKKEEKLNLKNLYRYLDTIKILISHNPHSENKLEEMYQKLELEEPPETIVVDTGPGSFTGIRIAVSFAKGLAIALKQNLYPLSILTAICVKKYLQNPDKKEYTASIDAKHNNSYQQKCDITQSSIKCTKPTFEKSPASDNITAETLKYLVMAAIVKNKNIDPIKVIPTYVKKVNITKRKHL